MSDGDELSSGEKEMNVRIIGKVSETHMVALEVVGVLDIFVEKTRKLASS